MALIVLAGLVILGTRAAGGDRTPAPPKRSGPPHHHHHQAVRVTAWHWATGPVLPTPTDALSLAAGDGMLLAVGGITATGTVGTVTAVNSVRSSVPSLSLATPVHDNASAVVGHTLYVFGGGVSTSLPTIQALPLSGAAAPSPAPLPEPLSDLGAVVRGQAVYLVGGNTGSTSSNQIWRWTPTAGVSAVATMPTGVRYAGVAWYQGRIIVAGGMVPASASSATSSDTVYAVNPSTGAVEHLDPLPVPLMYGSLAVYQGSLYLAGGLTISGATDAVWRYEGTAKGWVAGSQQLPVATYRGALATFNHHLWYVGGITGAGAPTAQVWMSALTGTHKGGG